MKRFHDIVYAATDFGPFTFRVRQLCPGMFEAQAFKSGKLVFDTTETSKLRAIGACNGMRVAVVNLHGFKP